MSKTLFCWKKQVRLIKRHLDGSVRCSKAFMYLPALMVLWQMCKWPTTWAPTHPHAITDAMNCVNWQWVSKVFLSPRGNIFTEWCLFLMQCWWFAGAEVSPDCTFRKLVLRLLLMQFTKGCATPSLLVNDWAFQGCSFYTQSWHSPVSN